MSKKIKKQNLGIEIGDIKITDVITKIGKLLDELTKEITIKIGK